MAVKATLKVKHTGADARKIANAFREVHANVPKNVVATGKTGPAKQKMLTAIALSKARKAGASIPDSSGSNYVSPNKLYVSAGVTGQGTMKWTRGSERVKPTGQSDFLKNPQGLHDYPTHDEYCADRFPDSYTELASVKPVEARMKINPVEQLRQDNNKTRDMRTNLGRGKSGIVSAEEENNVQETR